MGAVYEARQRTLDRRVALKLLPPELGTDEAFAERFRREARTLGRLQHPHLLTVFEFGQSTAGHWFFSMEYVEGGDLAQRLARAAPAPAEALAWLRQICGALAAAHAQGVTHRDLKPSNILLTADGLVKVADFGLAVSAGTRDERLTGSGLTLGTFEYAAPEQAAGARVDARSDLFSVGVLAYEMLTRRLPRGVFDPPSHLNPLVPVAVDAVVLRALQSDPARRYAEASELEAEFRRLAGPGESAPAHAAPTRHRRPGRRRAFALAAAVVLAGTGGSFLWRVPERAPAPPAAEERPGAGTAIVFWGDDSLAQGNVPARLSGVRELRAGWGHNLALMDDQSVVAWGWNEDGQTNVPPNLTGVVAIAAGAKHSLALKSDGTVIAWGRKQEGQCAVPAGLRDVVAIAAGWKHTVVVRRDGGVVAWGDNKYGQINVPPDLPPVQSISAGNAHTLGLLRDGRLVGWGDNLHGACTVPDGLTDIAAFAAGGFHNVVLQRDGSLVVWGNNDANQTRVPLAARSGVKAIAAGYRHTIALRLDGSVIAWGWNNHGQSTVPAGLSGVQAVVAAERHSLALLDAPRP